MRLAILFALSLPAVALAQDLGPISTRNHRAIALPFLRFDPHTGLVPDGHVEWDAIFQSANDSRRLPLQGQARVEEDQETERLLLRWRRGLSKGREFSVEVPFLSRGGGFLDPIITSWHANVLHWQEPFRASQPFGRSVVAVPGSRFGSAAGLGDVALFLSQQLAQRFVGSWAVKFPTGDGHRLLGSGGADAGGVIKGRWGLRKRLVFHAMGGLIAQSPGTALDSVRGLVHEESMALCWQSNGRDDWVLQWIGEASPVQTGVAGSDATHRQLTIGYQRLLGHGRMLELSFNEDRDVFNGRFPEGANVAPDFTIGISLFVRK
ncbi:MAG: hypothetical protein HYR64_08665 [Fimbriimonas ginsengisoli]|uniref:DUF3187 family protein n=1 Tax=Fimbriimonas ginsengisoli TaxID=1005039 RepID=A0A931LWW6_FIMGI|nr:hypothetical protein [Fimbriimonas ginsengisoli]